MKIAEKINSLNVSLTDVVKREADKSATAKQQFEQTSDDDYKRAMQKAATKENYVQNFLDTVTESEFKYCAKTFALDAVIDVCNDSYSMKKLRALVKALDSNDKSKLNADNQLATFCAVFATADAEAHINVYRADCKSARQLQMCHKLFDRLDIITREKRESRAIDYLVKRDNAKRAAVEALYD